MTRPRSEIEADIARLAVELRRRSNAVLDRLGIQAPTGLRAMLSRDAVEPILKRLEALQDELSELEAAQDTLSSLAGDRSDERGEVPGTGSTPEAPGRLTDRPQMSEAAA